MSKPALCWIDGSILPAAEARVSIGGADVIPARRRASADQLVAAATGALDASSESGEVRLAR